MTVSGGSGADCSGEMSGEADVDDGLEDVVVEAVDENGVETSIAATSAAAAAIGTLSSVAVLSMLSSDRGSTFTLTSSAFTAATGTGCPAGTGLSLTFHSLPLLCCPMDCDCTAAAVCRGEGARAKLNGR